MVMVVATVKVLVEVLEAAAVVAVIA